MSLGTTAHILDGAALAKQLQQEIKERIDLRVEKKLVRPGLAVVLIGTNPASLVYVNKKIQQCKAVGIESFPHFLSENTSEKELLDLIQQLNKDPKVHGILVQFPLPAHIHPTIVSESIDPRKDVDGFHPYNIGRLA